MRSALLLYTLLLAFTIGATPACAQDAVLAFEGAPATDQFSSGQLSECAEALPPTPAALRMALLHPVTPRLAERQNQQLLVRAHGAEKAQERSRTWLYIAGGALAVAGGVLAAVLLSGSGGGNGGGGEDGGIAEPPPRPE